MFYRQRGSGNGTVIATIIIVILSLTLLYFFFSNRSGGAETVDGTLSPQEVQTSADPESQIDAETDAEATPETVQRGTSTESEATEHQESSEREAGTEAEDGARAESGAEAEAAPERVLEDESQVVPDTESQAAPEQAQNPVPSEAQAVREDTQAAKEHTVSKGDTLASIAREHGATVAALAEANALTNPHQLGVGQVLTIPQSPASEEDADRTYTVKQGDTLYSVAKRYATSVEALRDANGIADITVIQSGQVLTLPPDALTVPK